MAPESLFFGKMMPEEQEKQNLQNERDDGPENDGSGLAPGAPPRGGWLETAPTPGQGDARGIEQV